MSDYRCAWCRLIYNKDQLIWDEEIGLYLCPNCGTAPFYILGDSDDTGLSG